MIDLITRVKFIIVTQFENLLLIYKINAYRMKIYYSYPYFSAYLHGSDMRYLFILSDRFKNFHQLHWHKSLLNWTGISDKVFSNLSRTILHFPRVINHEIAPWAKRCLFLLCHCQRKNHHNVENMYEHMYWHRMFL